MKRALFFAVLPFFTIPILGVAQSVVYPDLQVITPVSEISIGNPTPSTRELRFSHITWNAGAGPLEIRPSFNSGTGYAQGSQRLYTRNSSGQLTPVQDVPITIPLKWVYATGTDYQFPLSAFGLYSDANGSVGALVASSPKVDFCMTEDFTVSGATVDAVPPFTGTQFQTTYPVLQNTPQSVVYDPSNCGNPNGTLGLSVGWGDKYDYLDLGENIDITSLPDGVYWLRSTADPYHLLQESDPTNNMTDTQLRISGNTVTPLQRKQTDSTPPTVTLTSPAPGAVTGTVTLTATATPSAPSGPVTTVQFFIDGVPLGAPVTSTTSTYSTTWNASNAPGGHVLTAQAQTATGYAATAPPVSVTVATAIGSFLVLDQTLNVDSIGTTTTTSAFSASASNELLIALVGADGPSMSQAQSAAVSGAGLNWTLVSRANVQFGTAEVWAATATAPLSNVTVTSTESKTGYHQSLTVLALHSTSGAASAGAHAAASALQGTPSVSVTTTGNGSWVVGVGNDWDNAVPRTLGANQQLLHQWVDTGTGDTYWMQAASAATPAANTVVTLNDTAPTADRWNFSTVEVLAAGAPPPPPDTTPPTVAFVTPANNSTLSGTVTVTATASDNVALRATNPVLFYLDTLTPPLPGPVTVNGSQYSALWDTTQTANGTHSLRAVATDSSNNTATATVIGLTVSNPAPPNPCFILDASAVAHGRGPVTTPALRTSLPGERLFAFAGSDGPSNRKQTLTVSSTGGLTWTLVRRANGQPGDAEVWTALASAALSNVTVTARQAISGYDASLYVVAYQGVGGVGASVAGSAPNRAPSVTVTATKAGSLFYAVGNDWDNAVPRTVGPNQKLDDQWLDTNTGDTYWVQNETFPPSIPAGTAVTLNDTAPTVDHWNFAGVEILNDD
jgi:hypothetical protein